MDYEVELETDRGRDQTQESLVVRYADGSTERLRLHDYERVYAIAGLYEEVVQRRLQCASPRTLADLLLRSAADAGVEAHELGCFDLGAGNGVVAEELRARGVGAIVGSDNIASARDAALRDRPGLYADYLVGDADDLPDVAGLIAEHRLNALVSAGALGLGHITADSFARLWSAFPAGSWFAVTVHEDLAEPGGSDFGDYLAALERRAIVARERFRHRLTMSGDPIHYVAIVARKGPR
jgi:hypothetical protein